LKQLFNKKYAFLRRRGNFAGFNFLMMRRILLLFAFLGLIVGNASAQWCIPSYTNGTGSNDYIESVYSGAFGNYNTGFSGGPSYNDYSATITPAGVTEGGSYNMFVVGGNYWPDYYAVWIDYNYDGFFSSSEKIGEQVTSTTFQTMTFAFTVPIGSWIGTTRMRVRCAYSAPNMDPCATYDYGETEDYSIIINSAGGYCLPTYTNGGGGDYINSFSLGSINNVTGANTSAPYYSDYSFLSTNLTLGQFYTATVQAGTFSNNSYAIWIDYNQDGDFFDANEKLGELTNTSTFQNLNISFTVPFGAFTGPTLMRVRNAYATTNLDPCTQYSFGETEDYAVNITSGGGSGYCTNIHSFGCSTTDNINTVSITGTTLNNAFSGCGNTTTAYTNYPAVGNFTGTVINGQNYTLNVTTTSQSIISVWIDLNNDQVFSTTEWLQVTTSSTPNVAASLPFNITGATPGTYRMRIRSRLINNANGAGDACTLFGSGETEDYTITVSNGGVPPVADFSAASGANGIDFFDASTGNPTSWFWQFPGSNTPTSTLQNPTGITYNTPGCYDVTLTVSNAWGSDSYTFPCLVSVPQAVGCNELMFSEYLEGSGPANNNKALELYNASNAALSLSQYSVETYSNGSLTPTYTQSLSGTIASHGTFVIAHPQAASNILLIANLTSNVCFFDGNDVVVLKKNGVIIDKIGGTIGVDPGTPFTVAGGAGSMAEYTLVRTAATDRPDTFWPDVQNEWTVYPQNTTAYLGSHTSPCSSPVQPPSPNFSASTTAVCTGGCINFTDLSLNNPTVWSWSFPGSNTPTSTQQNPSNICYNSPGTYLVSLTVSNAGGTNTLTQNAYVTVTAAPVANAGNNVSICQGATTNLNASGGTTYSWSPTTGLSNPFVSNPVASPAQTTTYTVTVSNGNCSSIASVTVTVNAVSANAGQDISICSGASGQLNASGGTNYSWSPTTGLSNPNVQNPLAFPTSTTIYTVTVSNNGCTAADVVVVTVENPQIAAPTDPTICLGDQAWIQMIGGGANYQWNPTTGVVNPTGSGTLVGPAVTTTYTVSALVNGCPASDQVTVFVNNPPAAPIINQVGPDLVTPSPAVFYQWNFNGNPIPGATFPSVFPDQVGNYTVTITDANGCTATSQPFLVTITGLKNLSVNAELRVYPNPAHQLVSVEIPASTSGSTLEIMNALGQSLEQVMIKANANGQKTNLNLETYAPGVYFIRWNGQDGQTVKRLVIE
jgi:PKD repeat protein